MIIINDTLRINGEGTSWTVEKYKGKRFDKEKQVEYDYWEPQTYHSRVESALDSVMNLQMKELPNMDIKEFLVESKKIKSALKTFLEIK